MSYIEDIVKTEEESKKIIAEARNEATQRIHVAQQEQEKELLGVKNKLAEDRANKLEDQKKELGRIYKEIVQKGEQTADKLKGDLKKKEDGAVSHLLKKILSS